MTMINSERLQKFIIRFELMVSSFATLLLTQIPSLSANSISILLALEASKGLMINTAIIATAFTFYAKKAFAVHLDYLKFIFIANFSFISTSMFVIYVTSIQLIHDLQLLSMISLYVLLNVTSNMLIVMLLIKFITALKYLFIKISLLIFIPLHLVASINIAVIISIQIIILFYLIYLYKIQVWRATSITKTRHLYNNYAISIAGSLIGYIDTIVFLSLLDSNTAGKMKILRQAANAVIPLSTGKLLSYTEIAHNKSIKLGNIIRSSNAKLVMIYLGLLCFMFNIVSDNALLWLPALLVACDAGINLYLAVHISHLRGLANYRPIYIGNMLKFLIIMFSVTIITDNSVISELSAYFLMMILSSVATIVYLSRHEKLP